MRVLFIFTDYFLQIMKGLTIKDTKDKLVFTIDKDTYTEEVFIQLMEVARVEYLVSKADFHNPVYELGESIKSDWWKGKRSQILKRIGR